MHFYFVFSMLYKEKKMPVYRIKANGDVWMYSNITYILDSNSKDTKGRVLNSKFLLIQLIHCLVICGTFLSHSQSSRE